MDCNGTILKAIVRILGVFTVWRRGRRRMKSAQFSASNSEVRKWTPIIRWAFRQTHTDVTMFVSLFTQCMKCCGYDFEWRDQSETCQMRGKSNAINAHLYSSHAFYVIALKCVRTKIKMQCVNDDHWILRQSRILCGNLKSTNGKTDSNKTNESFTQYWAMDVLLQLQKYRKPIRTLSLCMCRLHHSFFLQILIKTPKWSRTNGKRSDREKMSSSECHSQSTYTSSAERKATIEN